MCRGCLIRDRIIERNGELAGHASQLTTWASRFRVIA
jgi:hypothetical protein